MPRSAICLPRNMFPPPTTAASSTPPATTAAISLARWKTTSGEMPSGSLPEKASPESFTTTRFQRRCAFGASGSGYPSASATADVTDPAAASARTAAPAECVALPSTGCSPSPSLTSWLRSSSGLADLVPRERADGNPLIGEQLLDGLLRVPDKRLLGQHHVLEERVEPALDDLGNRLLRLALVPGDLLHDAPLVLDHVRGHLVTGQVLRPHRGHLVRHVLGRLGRGLVQLDEHAHGRRQLRVGLVQVGSDVATLEEGVPAQLDLLLERGAGLLDVLLDRGPGPEFQPEQGQPVGGPLLQGHAGDLRGQGLEHVGLGHEVGLAVELEEHPGVRAVELRGHQPVRGGAGSPLAYVLGALDPEELHGDVEVAVGLLKSTLAVHHSRGRLLTQPLHVRGGEVRHFLISRCVFVVGRGSPPLSASPSPSPSAGPLPQASADSPEPADTPAASGSGAGASPCSGAAPLACSAAWSAAWSVAVPLAWSGVVPLTWSPAGAPGAWAAASSPGLPSRTASSHSASGSSAPSSPDVGAAEGLASPSAAPARAIRPSATASAMTRVSSETLRMASSFPGIG